MNSPATDLVGPSPPALMPVALGSGLVVLLVGLLAWSVDSPALAPPLGVTAFLCQQAPGARVSRIRSVLGGHLLGILSGLVALWIAGALDLPSALEGPFTLRHALAAALAIGLTVASTEGLGLPHPPAAATTLVVALGLLTEGRALLAFVLGTLAVVLMSNLVHGIRARSARRSAGRPIDDAGPPRP